MLQITVPEKEFFNEKTNEFFWSKETVLQLEHSLLSLSKWESKWHKPFLTQDKKSDEETLDYIRCMTINSHVDPIVYLAIGSNRDLLETITKYIDDPATATTFSKNAPQKAGQRKETITAEIIYYWMISLNIPMECQKWHLNRLLTLVRVCDIKNTPPKKMGSKEALAHHAALNKARRRH